MVYVILKTGAEAQKTYHKPQKSMEPQDLIKGAEIIYRAFKELL